MKRLFLGSILLLAGILLGPGTGGFVSFLLYSRSYAVVRAFSWMQIGLAVSENAFDSNSSSAKKVLANTLYSMAESTLAD